MRFDLDMYRSLDPASRRLFLLILKVGYRGRRLPVFDLRYLAVDVLGLSATLSVRDMKVKVSRTLQRLSSTGVLSNSVITRKATGHYQVSMEPGKYLSEARNQLAPPRIEDSPLIDGLLEIGFDHASAAKIVNRYPQSLVAQWTDITQAALERFGRQHFRKSPMAFLVDSLSKASQGLRTPPDWWHEIRRKEQKTSTPTTKGRRILGQLLDEVFGSERNKSDSSPRPESAASLLKTLA